MGYAFSPALISQEQASSILTRWLQIFSTAAVWSGGLLKFIPYADTAISAGSGADLQHAAVDPDPDPDLRRAQTAPAFVTVAARRTHFVSDGGVVYAFSTTSRSERSFRRRQRSTCGRRIRDATVPGPYIFGPADEGKPVVITYTAGSAGSFTPNLTPVYDLTDSDFIDEKGNKDPVQVERVDVFSLPTIQRVEVLSRSNQYSARSGRGARSKPDRDFRPARRVDNPGA